MGIVLDIILVLVLIAVIIASAKKGILVTVVELAAFVLALILASNTAAPVAEVTYKALFSSRVERSLQEVLPENSSKLTNSQKAQYVFDNLPDFAKNQAEKCGIDVSSIARQIGTGGFEDGDSLYKSLAQDIVKPIAVTVLKHIMYFVLAVLYAIVLRAILKSLCKGMKKLRLIGSADKTVGGIIGIAKGVVIVFLLGCLLSYLQPRFENEKLVQAITESSIVELCEEFDPMEAISAAEVFINNNIK